MQSLDPRRQKVLSMFKTTSRGVPFSQLGGQQGGGMPAMPNITPSQGVLPPIHSQANSQIALNNVRALTPEMPELIKQYDRPGVSRSAGNMARALGDMAGFKAQESQAAFQIPFNANLTNNRQLLQEQVNRENETMQLANYWAQQQDMQANFQRNVLSQLLGSIFGAIGGMR